MGSNGHAGDLAEHTELNPSERLLAQSSTTRYFAAVNLKYSQAVWERCTLHLSISSMPRRRREGGESWSTLNCSEYPVALATASAGWASPRLTRLRRQNPTPEGS
jgi:hypothetical protein